MENLFFLEAAAAKGRTENLAENSFHLLSNTCFSIINNCHFTEGKAEIPTEEGNNSFNCLSLMAFERVHHAACF